MADNQNIPQRPSVASSFTGGMIKDLLDSFIKEGSYVTARNAVNNLPDGVVGGISTEPATVLCVNLPYTLIGAIPLSEALWMLFFTDDINSEIGEFNEATCTYTTITGNQPCLNFNRASLISGASRRGFDCGFNVYWADNARNPNRFINTAKVPWIQNCTTLNNCITCVDTTVLDCQQLRIAPFFKVPCLTLAKGEGSGTLLNGSYQVAIRYAINSIACTDFIALSNVMSIWSHTGIGGGVRLLITGAETTTFTDMEVVVISMTNFQVQARSLGIYSTSQSNIYIDDLDKELIIVPLNELPINTPSIEKSDFVSTISNYLIEGGVYTRPDFNYQPLANLIVTKWAAVIYPDDYYHKSGNALGMNVGYLRDEVYAYYIRWVYASGDKSASYHIPGRVASAGPTLSIGGPGVPGSLGTSVSGLMRGYESTERYPDRSPDVWGTLCGQRIRHHRFPDQTDFSTGSTPLLSHFGSNFTISIMGVFFENIQLPVDNNGNLIPDIQGYEILRAVREGHKSIIAKGMVNHMKGYTNPDGTVGLYQNYPYDDLRSDWYLTNSQIIGTVGGTVVGTNNGQEPTIIKSDYVTFHSPDTSFQNPVLGLGSLVLYEVLAGISTGSFNIPYQHPKFKLLTDLSSIFAFNIGLLATILNLLNTVSGGTTTLGFGATQDLPLNTPMGLAAVPEGPVGSIGSIVYGAMIGISATINVLLAPIHLKAIQTQIMNVINGLVPAIQYAKQYDSHGFYNIPQSVIAKTAHNFSDYQYIKGHLQTFTSFDINNLFRNDYLALALTTNIPSLPSWVIPDRSRFTMSESPQLPTYIGPFNTPIASFYGAVKVPQLSQYGQVDSPKQVPISCVFPVSLTPGSRFSTPILFGGDTYINRYTEKNPFFFFNSWLVGQPDDYNFDYTNYENVPYPRFWINNTKVYYDLWGHASENWHLDELGAAFPSFYVYSGYFYLFCNGVRDFYVESSMNMGYRDWEDVPEKRFYDPYGYTSLAYLFRSDYIKSDVFYKYDESLSAGRFYNQYLSWGACLGRDYDPQLAFTCYAYYPRRLHYSLSQEEEFKRDNWRLFLANNYKDFPSKVTAIKDINQTGALILQADQAPLLLPGVQSIPSTNGADFTTGTGQLFGQALQSITNVDDSYQYGSCQNRLSVLGTPYGIFWASQRTGKIFCYRDGLEDISNTGMKWWLSRYLPSQLLQQYPDYPYPDNPVIGVGVQLIYDAVNEVLYICKKDYKATSSFIGLVGDQFIYNDRLLVETRVALGDPRYFENASWTLSYDCKNKQFISFHDWYPSLNIGAKQHFLTSNGQGKQLWRHNTNTGLFCNYYGIDYPFAIEFPITTGVNVNTIESVEAIMESYNYKANQTDKFNQFANFFDKAIVFNNEQSTLLMRLQEAPWNNPYAKLQYPFIDSLGLYNILYSKVENKYRFSQLKDFTNDRGEFTLTLTQLLQTSANGYTFALNSLYLDTNKQQIQQKKIRHYSSRIYLERTVVGNNSMTLRYIRTNTLNSLR